MGKDMYKCTGLCEGKERYECHHSKPHERRDDCEVLSGNLWVECQPGSSKTNDGLVRCEKLTTKKELVDMILEWWEEARYETVPCGDGDCDNLYSEEPDFVTEARKIKEEVIIE